ncbi:MAG: VCBS repeat-containing protein, partial [Saprospiraceae bacterium]
LDFRGMATQASFFDYDLDNDLDMFLLCHSNHATDNYRDTSRRHIIDSISGDRLFRNDGNRFTDVTQKTGIISSKIGYGLGLVISDLNDDGCPDIYVGNDFHENDYLYYNNCDGTFRESITSTTNHNSTFTMGVDIADVNNDLKPDVLTLDMRPEDYTVLESSVGADNWGIYDYKLRYGYHHQFARNMLQINQGDLRQNNTVQFSEQGQLAGIEATDWSWSPLIADFDLDGWKDIVISNGIYRRPNDLDYLKTVNRTYVNLGKNDELIFGNMPEGKVVNYAFRNLKNGIFEKVSEGWGFDQLSCSTGAAYADLDNDGDLDLVMNNINQAAFILKNNVNELLENNYLKVKLTGPNGNSKGLNTKVSIVTNGKSQFQELTNTKGFQSASDPKIIFGLEKNTNVGALLVTWPDGKSQKIKQPKINETINVNYKNATPNQAKKTQQKTLFNNSSNQISLPFRHFENNYADITKEALMPRLLSREGPKLAKGDVNSDGLEDFYICGADGQGGALFIQKADGTFQASNEDLWRQQISFEETDAAFFDTDGDKDLDLYVVHGGNQRSERSIVNADHLYLNDGKGNFTKTEDRLPDFKAQGSCVRPFDFDRDGDIDLFVGSRVLHRNYGKSPVSYLLENNGKGFFKIVTGNIAPELSKIGMVTDAVWKDINGDQKTDLIIVGEWMPVTIFISNNNTFTKQVIPDSEGWWNTIAAEDFDKDGDIDLVGGNLGLNTYLEASPTEPIQLRLKDLDNNGSDEILLSHFVNGVEEPLHQLDDLASQSPQIKKQFENYQRFSEQSFSDIFPNNILQGAVTKQAVTLASTYFENDGAGQFTAKALPTALQVSTIQSMLCEDFDGDGNVDILTVGNFYEVPPVVGRFDAGYGRLLIGDGNGNFEAKESVESGFAAFGQVRDMEVLELATFGKIVVCARNDDGVLVFKIN